MNSRCVLLGLDRATSPSVREFARYWGAKRGDAIPPRSAIDPLEIPHLLPLVVIAQIEPDPFRVRYRLVGTRAISRFSDSCRDRA